MGVGCQTHPSHLLAAGYPYRSHTFPENLEAKLMEAEDGSVHLSLQMDSQERGQADSVQ